MRCLCEWITLAENRWPHIGRKLTQDTPEQPRPPLAEYGNRKRNGGHRLHTMLGGATSAIPLLGLRELVQIYINLTMAH
jgi:hypothetical protein